MEETKPARRASVRLPMGDRELRDRRLTVNVLPELNKSGKGVVFTERQDTDRGNAYRFLLANCPTGLGVRVGITGTSYEVSRRGPGGFRRVTLGSVHDLSFDKACDEARRMGRVIEETGENPKARQARQDALEEVRDITVKGCFEAYIKDLERRHKLGKVKAASIDAVKDSLKRLARPEVDLARWEVRAVTKEVATEAFNATRLSCMRLSNRIPTRLREALADVKDWTTLTTEELEKRGVEGKYVQRVREAGKAAAEHTLGDAIRAVNFVLEDELEKAQMARRTPQLYANPLKTLYKQDLFRTPADLRKHYERARVRNPLGDHDQSLARVLKALVARRDEQGGHNRAGADYLLLTLLWGTRRSEGARLQWWDLANPAERAQREVSWVWLAEPHEVNPLTRKAGSQVYFHDTKSGDERFLPVCYFAERILRRRLDERDQTIALAPERIERARRELMRVRRIPKAERKQTWGQARTQFEIERARLTRAKWLFPARSHRAKAGHYIDSKAIIANIRRDAGLADHDLDIGLTPHDLRRTLGRYAEQLFRGGRLVSQMLHHTVRNPDADGTAADVSALYTEQEWVRLREAFGQVEEAIIATSPRVWNRLKGPDKPRLDEVNDPPLRIFRRQKDLLTDGLVSEAGSVAVT